MLRSIDIERAAMFLDPELERHAKAHPGGERHRAWLDGSLLEVWHDGRSRAAVATADARPVWLGARSALEAVRRFAEARKATR
jgi:hypothetical protein